jgi:hypothetical protein
MPQCSPREVIRTKASETAATTTNPMTATTNGRHPVRVAASLRMFITLRPRSVAVDADGNIYATDTGNDRVVVLPVA